MDSSTHRQRNILDLVLTNIEDSIHSLTVLNRNHQLISSDHYPITFVLSHSVISPHNSPTYFYDFSKGDYEGLSYFLANCDFSDCYNSDDVEFIWFIIKGYIISAMELYIPKVKVRSHQYPKWFTAHLRHQVKCLRTLRRKIKNHFTLSQLDRLIDAENNFSQQFFRAKRDYEHNLINKYACSRDPGIYRYIHSLTNSRSLPLVLHNDSTVVTTDMDKANAFNQYFYSILSMIPQLHLTMRACPVLWAVFLALTYQLRKFLMHSPTYS